MNHIKKLTKVELEQRTKKRRTKLIARCRYYKDDFENPWEYCYNPTLVWRKDMWELEKEWVEALSKTYRCDMTKHDLLDSFHLTDFIRANKIPASLMNHILTWAKNNADKERNKFIASDAVLLYEKYIMLTPLANDFRKYYAYYFGEEYEPQNHPYNKEEKYAYIGWHQERLLNDSGLKIKTSWAFAKDHEEHRGEEGIWGWYADQKFPVMQKELLFFICCNWIGWCSYDYKDIDDIAEKYLNYHYPGNEELKGTTINYDDNFWLRAECEEAAEKECKKVYGKDVDVELYMMYDDHCYFLPALSYVDEKDFEYPVLVKVDYEYLETTVICNEESKVIDDEIRAYKRKHKTEQHCIFYKGEEQNPFEKDDWKHTQWECEKLWVESDVESTTADKENIFDFLMRFPDELSFDPRPLSYKAFIYDHHTRWQVRYPGEDDVYYKQAKEISEKIIEYLKEIKGMEQVPRE